jgi:DNA replication and repair protein RecF
LLRSAACRKQGITVKIDFLRIANLRCFEHATFAPGPCVNWLIGPNGSGKTTLLEAAYILSHGRSFRAGGRSAPCRQGAEGYLVQAEINRDGRSGIKLGLARRNDKWQARKDGNDLNTLAPLFEACPVVCFEPESQMLILGPSEGRRSFLDWSVFHVEHASLELWRTWRRTLRQRNALLRIGGPDAEFEPWEHDLGLLADRIHRMRKACLDSLNPYLVEEADRLIPELGEPWINYRPGWDVDIGLSAQLAEHRGKDRERGFTQRGAHRADWVLGFARIAQREHLSRGQAKAIALVCVLALTRWLNDRIGEYPLLCLDDLASEFDTTHVTKAITWLTDKPVQAWLTATTRPDARYLGGAVRMFHVEHSGATLRRRG